MLKRGRLNTKQKQKNKKPSIKPKTKQNKTKQVPHIDENYSFSQSIADKQCKHSKKKNRNFDQAEMSFN